MANSQGGFYATVPSNAYGSTVRFNASSAVKTIAGNVTNKWATTGNLVNNLDSDHYIECSVTYFASGGGQPQGWYFWCGYLSRTTGKIWEQYTALGYDPSTTGNTIKIRLWYPTAWKAQYDDISASGHSISVIIGGSPLATSLYTSKNAECFLESDGTTCSNWSSLTGSNAVSFNTFKYYDPLLQEMTYTPTFSAFETSREPTCSVGGPCLNETISGLTVSYRGC